MFKTQKSVAARFASALLVMAVCATTTPAVSTRAQEITLTFYHWKGADAGPTIDAINKAFEAANPGIKIEFESANTDTYQQVLPIRLAAGDAPDVYGVFPGESWISKRVEGNYLADLSDQPWVSRLGNGAKSAVTYNGKIYALPLDQNVIGVVYNKKIFRDAGVSVPTTWEEFLSASEAIKNAGVTPIALGIKDQWVTQLIPYAMSPTAIYRDNPDFEAEITSGKATFANSPWKQMMLDYVDLNTRGYFNNAPLGTTYDQTVQLMATGKTAMVVNGNWIISPIRAAAPDIELGMFPLPYTKLGSGDIWVPSSTGVALGVSATTAYPKEARAFVEYWASQSASAQWVAAAGAFPVLTDVTPEIDPTAAEMLPALKVGSAVFPDSKWPDGIQGVVLKSVQGVFSEQITIDQMLADMDAEWQARTSAQPTAEATTAN